MYADDTILFYAASKVNALQERLNEELKVIECWLPQNNLFLNVYKTEAMVFGTSPCLSNMDSFTIRVNGTSIKRVSQFKYLGVVFDERLSWNDHVKFILAKAGKGVEMLGRICYCITWHSAKIIYTSMIRPIIEYCDTVWGYCGEINKNASESLQRWAGRIVCRASSSEDAIEKLNLTTLAYGQSKHTLNLGNKCIKRQCAQFLKNYFTLNKHLYSCDTHQKTLIHLPSVRTEIAKQSFYYYGSIVYNSSK